MKRVALIFFFVGCVLAISDRTLNNTARVEGILDSSHSEPYRLWVPVNIKSISINLVPNSCEELLLQTQIYGFPCDLSYSQKNLKHACNKMFGHKVPSHGSETFVWGPDSNSFVVGDFLYVTVSSAESTSCKYTLDVAYDVCPESQMAATIPDGTIICKELQTSYVDRTSSCTTTLNPGADLAKTLGSASPNDVVCLNSGNYGSLTLTDVSKKGPVTVRTTSGNDATFYFTFSGATTNFIFDSLSIDGGTILDSVKNVTFSNIVWLDQLVIKLDTTFKAGILVTNCTFNNISVCADCYEGRLQVANQKYPVGVTVQYSHFGNAGESDGIQTGAQGLVVGPGNIFDGIIQGNYQRHCDAFQGYGQSYTTIFGNLFRNGDTYLMMPDGGEGEIITHNVFDTGYAAIQLGSHVGDIFEHNTCIDTDVFINKKTENTAVSKNCTARNNVMLRTTYHPLDGNNKQSCKNCTFTHSLFYTADYELGTDDTIAQPIFVGGSKPKTWAGYKLNATSPGVGAATDGTDMGSNYFGGDLPQGTTGGTTGTTTGKASTTGTTGKTTTTTGKTTTGTATGTTGTAGSTTGTTSGTTGGSTSKTSGPSNDVVQSSASVASVQLTIVIGFVSIFVL